MLYDPNNCTDLTQLEVCAATGLLHRSLDNEVRSAAQIMRLQTVLNKTNEELARARNVDVSAMQQTIAKQAEQIRVIGAEHNEVLQQFGAVKQREKTLSTENAQLQAQVEQLQEQLQRANDEIANLQPVEGMMATSKVVKEAPAKAVPRSRTKAATS